MKSLFVTFYTSMQFSKNPYGYLNLEEFGIYIIYEFDEKFQNIMKERGSQIKFSHNPVKIPSVDTWLDYIFKYTFT